MNHLIFFTFFLYTTKLLSTCTLTTNLNQEEQKLIQNWYIKAWTPYISELTEIFSSKNCQETKAYICQGSKKIFDEEGKIFLIRNSHDEIVMYIRATVFENDLNTIVVPHLLFKDSEFTTKNAFKLITQKAKEHWPHATRIVFPLINFAENYKVLLTSLGFFISSYTLQGYLPSEKEMLYNWYELTI